jgi:hypothetical protein
LNPDCACLSFPTGSCRDSQTVAATRSFATAPDVGRSGLNQLPGKGLRPRQEERGLFPQDHDTLGGRPAASPLRARSASRARSLLPGRGRRARAALAWAFLVFASLQVGMSVLMDYWRPEVRDPETGYKQVRLAKATAAEPARPLMLVMGTSRAALGVRPELLPPYRLPKDGVPLVFNDATTGTFPVQQLAALRSLLRAGIRPRWILLEVLHIQHGIHNPSSIAFSRLDRTKWADLTVLKRYCDRPWEVYLAWCLPRLAPCFSHRFPLLDQVAPNWTPLPNRMTWVRDRMDRSGWVWVVKTVTQDTYRAGLQRAHDEYAELLTDLRIGEMPDRALRALLALCRQEGIPVSLFLMPEDSKFRSWYSPATTAAWNDYLAGLSREFRVPVIDARAWVPDGQFIDGHHLLPRGAAVFTERFGREAIAPLLAARPGTP